MMPRETLNKTKSTRSNERAHASVFFTLRFIQRVPVIAEKEKEKPRYSQPNISIAVVGAHGRIGATTFAMRLAAYSGAVTERALWYAPTSADFRSSR